MIERILLSLLAFFALPTVARAAGALEIPEASSAMLFALGVIGVLIGRHASKVRRDRDR